MGKGDPGLQKHAALIGTPVELGLVHRRQQFRVKILAI
jgi:hypothetical protein